MGDVNPWAVDHSVQDLHFDILMDEQKCEPFGVAVIPEEMPAFVRFQAMPRQTRIQMQEKYALRLIHSAVGRRLARRYINPFTDQFVLPPEGGEQLFPELFKPLSCKDLEYSIRDLIYRGDPPADEDPDLERPLSSCIATLCFYLYGSPACPTGLRRNETDGFVHEGLPGDPSTGWDHAPTWGSWSQTDRRMAEVESRLGRDMLEMKRVQARLHESLSALARKADAMDMAQTLILQNQMDTRRPQRGSIVVPNPPDA